MTSIQRRNHSGAGEKSTTAKCGASLHGDHDEPSRWMIRPGASPPHNEPRHITAEMCRDTFPFSGAVFVFRSKRATAIKLLVYDGQGFWLCHKRLSQGRFRFWPSRANAAAAAPLRAHELAVLLSAGDPRWTQAAPEWRRVAATG